MTLPMMLRREMIAITVTYVLRHTALLPTSGDHVVQWGSKSQKTVLQQIGGNAWGFVWLQLLDAIISLSILGSASSLSNGGQLTVASTCRAEGVATFCLEQSLE